MGIRVHKSLGYGLTDVKPQDERINWDSWLMTAENIPPVEEYIAWLAERAEDRGGRQSLDQIMYRAHADDGTDLDLQDGIIYDDGGGLGEVLALRPPLSCRDWHRYADTIDWMEETYPPSGEPQRPHVRIFEHGIYPFNTYYMDKRDGRELANIHDMRMWQYYRDSDKAIRDTSAKALGFAAHEEALENIVPQVPEEIRDIAEFAGLFTDDKTWLQLRPLLYVWWS